jgi:hypothetical protein
MTKDFVAIIPTNSNSYTPNTRFFCSLCNCKLSPLNVNKEEWVCTRCNISYFPNKGEKVKRANKFSTLGPATDSHGNITGDKMPIVSIIDDKQNLSSAYKQPKLSPFFKDILSRPGVRLIDYQTSED